MKILNGDSQKKSKERDLNGNERIFGGDRIKFDDYVIQEKIPTRNL